MKHNPIFILGRFRSGTSYFWHIFNQLPGFKAWYEPLHPQLLSQIKYTKPKVDHVYIEDYWASYRSIQDLAEHHHVSFGSERLYLTAQESWPELRKYVDFLLETSADKRPILQFNRMDLRIQWLMGFYPQAKILYLHRNPIQLWCSQRKHIPVSHRDDESYADAYELMQWCADLAPLLPFLTPQHGRHAFYRFYLLYRLSVIMGLHHADVVIDLDKDVFNSDNYLQKLEVLGLTDVELKTAHGLKHIPEEYELPDEELELLTAIMTEVDALLDDSGLASGFATQNLTNVKQSHPDFWHNQHFDPKSVITELNQSWHQEQADKIKLLAELDQALAQVQDHE